MAVGVPLITHVVVLILSPAGSAGVVVQLVIADPLSANILGVIDIAELSWPVVPVDELKLMVGG